MFHHKSYNYSFLVFLMMLKLFIPSASFSHRCFNTVKSRKTEIVQRQRYPILKSMATQYTINDDVCPPIDEAELRKIVQKHCECLQRFTKNKPIAQHTSAAFDQILPHIDTTKKIILDSGCGTGRSTLLLGERYPSHTIIGVDRSFVRLNRNCISKKGDADSDSNENNQRPFQAVSSNVLLVRAELSDFWRCCLDAKLEVDQHYILYPNPYPKKNRIKKRFYAHPSFPIILNLGGSKIVVRSNWEGYLKEFAKSVEYADELYVSQEMENLALPYLQDAKVGPKERVDKTVAWTNFEKKYDDVGEKTYELILRKGDS
uniref:tRNA (guanine(46)-N(7))-methyltransferase n=1 Tax=Chaetoceros debilis TaxID=122233 RepID=A0A7S3PXI0_9STRA